MKTNRRLFLKNASVLTLGGLFAGRSNSVLASPHPFSNVNSSKEIGLQIYSLGNELYSDASGGLKKVAQMGYSTLELAISPSTGGVGNISLPDFKKMADDAGLKIISSHIDPPIRHYSPDNKKQIIDFWKKTTDAHAAIGVKFLIQPGQPSTRSTEEVAYVGEIFNEAGKIAKARGLSFGYHNHSGEFSRVIPGGTESIRRGGNSRNAPAGIEIIYDGLLRNTDPSLVFFQLDVYWCVMGQQDPVEYLKKYPGRIKILHIKDRAVLGQSGMMNFEMIFKQFYANNMKQYFVELEGISGMTQFEGVKGCADYLLNAEYVH